jgi:hypothetical protein
VYLCNKPTYLSLRKVNMLIMCLMASAKVELLRLLRLIFVCTML